MTLSKENGSIHLQKIKILKNYTDNDEWIKIKIEMREHIIEIGSLNKYQNNETCNHRERERERERGVVEF